MCSSLSGEGYGRSVLSRYTLYIGNPTLKEYMGKRLMNLEAILVIVLFLDFLMREILSYIVYAYLNEEINAKQN